MLQSSVEECNSIIDILFEYFVLICTRSISNCRMMNEYINLSNLFPRSFNPRNIYFLTGKSEASLTYILTYTDNFPPLIIQVNCKICSNKSCCASQKCLHICLPLFDSDQKKN